MTDHERVRFIVRLITAWLDAEAIAGESVGSAALLLRTIAAVARGSHNEG